MTKSAHSAQLSLPRRCIQMICLKLLLGSIEPTHAAEFFCSSGDVTCLVAAINEANSNEEENTIFLESGTYTLASIDNVLSDGVNGLPSITSSLTIIGDGAPSTVIERDRGAPEFRILNVAAEGVLRLEGLSVRGGRLGSLGAGMFNRGTATISNSIISDNEVMGFSGGIENSGTMTVTHSTISGNRAGFCCGGIGNFTRATLTIINSTISSNEALSHGGGLGNRSGFVTITNSTIANNVAEEGGGLEDIGSDFAGLGTINILNSTIAGNVASRGGGILNIVRGSAVFLQNTVVAQNTATDTGSDCFRGPVSLGNNFIGDPTDCSIINPSATDLTGDPGLGDFTDNGTPGNGHFPVLAGSRVIDAGNPDVCPERDQIGSQRVGPCDIGSVEFGGQIVVAIDVRPRTDKDRINPNSSQNINVAILSANGFDARLIDPTTVRFGATGTEAAPIHIGRRDVNGDGQRDLVLRFQSQDLGIECGATSVTLAGQLSNGQAITGLSPITTTGCKENRKKASALRHSHSFSS